MEEMGIRFVFGLQNELLSIDATAFIAMDQVYCIRRADAVALSQKQRSIAYIIHTSGTTRGGSGGIRVAVPTSSFLKNLRAISNRLEDTSHLHARICPLVSEITFDPCLIEICLPLLMSSQETAGSLVILERYTTRMPDKLFNDINKGLIDLLMMTPSLFMSLSVSNREAICRGETKIRDVVLGGEAFPDSLVDIRSGNVRLWNIYGTTECSVWAFMNLIESRPVCLGLPLGCTEWKIENNMMYLGGSERICYINDEIEPKILRDTGDLVREENGNLLFLGRRDSMIKRHGYRVHLNQISDLIQSFGLFDYINIQYIFRPPIDDIVCFYVGPVFSQDYIQERFAESLPWYSIPNVYRIQSMPLTQHGKVDISSLRMQYIASITSGERYTSLIDIISKRLSLALHEIDTTKHFFANGGNSFQAAYVVNDVLHFFGSKINTSASTNWKDSFLHSLFHEPIKDFIELVEKSTQLPENAIVKKKRTSLIQKSCSMEIIWTVNLEKCIDSSPIYSNNTIFIGSHSGLFAAIDSESGSIKWQKKFNNRIEGSPAISSDGKMVVFGCHDQFIYSLCTSSGDIIWSFLTQNVVKSCPIFQKCTGYIWIGSYDQNLYCIDSSSGKEIGSWNLGGSVYSKCAINEKSNQLFIPTTKGAVFSFLLQEDLSLNLKQWTAHLPPIFSDPLLDLDSGDIFVGCSDHNLYRLSGHDGSIIWLVSTFGPIFSSPIFWLDEIIIIGSYSAKLFFISKNGKILKNFESDSPIFGTPVLYKKSKCVYISIEGVIYIISKSKEISRMDTESPVFSSPIIHNGIIYFGSRNDKVYAIKTDIS